MNKYIEYGLSVLILGFAGFGAYSLYNKHTEAPPAPIVIEKTIEVPKIVEKPVVKIVEVPKIVEKVVEVPVPALVDPTPAEADEAPVVNEKSVGERVLDYFTTIGPVPNDRTRGKRD